MSSPSTGAGPSGKGEYGVAELAGHSAVASAAATRPFLAADVGGTHARIGLVSRDADAAQPVSVHAYQRYACAEWPSLTAVLEDFVAHVAPAAPIERCAVASAEIGRASCRERV